MYTFHKSIYRYMNINPNKSRVKNGLKNVSQYVNKFYISLHVFIYGLRQTTLFV